MIEGDSRFTAKLVEALYVDAMVLADEARSYFEGDGIGMGEDASAFDRVEMSCESLRVTTRLMHAIAWLLNQKAYFAGEISAQSLRRGGGQLGTTNPSDPKVVERLPAEAARLVRESEHLIERLSRLEASLKQGPAEPVPAEHRVHELQERLARELAPEPPRQRALVR